MSSRPVLVGLGEILWDVFPDGPRFGGAPANFACSAAELGGDTCEVQMASAVGADSLGDDALTALESHGVACGTVHRSLHPTGVVQVTLDSQGHASYTFAMHTAWDHIPWTDSLEQLAKRADVVCFGTLGQREAVSRETIRRFVGATPPHALRLLDLNLRPPFWNREVILESLPLANALKLNDTELPVVADLLNLAGNDAELLAQLRHRYGYLLVALTRGAQGALLLDSSGDVSDLPGQSTALVDTVGAGDSFSACLALGHCHALPLATINHWANQVAAFVCSQAGATPRMPPELALPRP